MAVRSGATSAGSGASSAAPTMHEGFMALPPELHSLIFSFLPFADRVRLKAVHPDLRRRLQSFVANAEPVCCCFFATESRDFLCWAVGEGCMSRIARPRLDFNFSMSASHCCCGFADYQGDYRAVVVSTKSSSWEVLPGRMHSAYADDPRLALSPDNTSYSVSVAEGPLFHVYSSLEKCWTVALPPGPPRSSSGPAEGVPCAILEKAGCLVVGTFNPSTKQWSSWLYPGVAHDTATIFFWQGSWYHFNQWEFTFEILRLGADGLWETFMTERTEKRKEFYTCNLVGNFAAFTDHRDRKLQFLVDMRTCSFVKPPVTRCELLYGFEVKE